MTYCLEASHLVKSFPGFRLGSLDLALETGVVLGYVGPNGSGKTTTIQCLAGLLRPEEGEIRICGRPLDLRTGEWKEDIGYVGDRHVFYERWSGAQNLQFLSRFFPRWSMPRAQELAGRFALPLDQKAKNLSRGNRVKLSLVSVLARAPKLLLLDEPTAALDPVARAEVLDVLFEVLESGETSIFYSTHILSDIARLADELAFLEHGRLLFRTAKEDLLENWRKISCRLSPDGSQIAATVSIRREGASHQIVSSDYRNTLEDLRTRGAEGIHVNRMTIDEIAVQILKGGPNVVTAGSRN